MSTHTHLPFQHRCRPTSFQVARGLSRITLKRELIERVAAVIVILLFFSSCQHAPRHFDSTQLRTCLHTMSQQRTQVGSSCAIIRQSSISHFLLFFCIHFLLFLFSFSSASFSSSSFASSCASLLLFSLLLSSVTFSL